MREHNHNHNPTAPSPVQPLADPYSLPPTLSTKTSLNSQQYPSHVSRPLHPTHHPQSTWEKHLVEDDWEAVTHHDAEETQSETSITRSASLSPDTAASLRSPTSSNTSAKSSNGPNTTGKRARNIESEDTDCDIMARAETLSLVSKEQGARDSHNLNQCRSRERLKRWLELLQIFRDNGIDAADAKDFWKHYEKEVGAQNKHQHWLRRTITEDSIYIYFVAMGKRYAELLEEQKGKKDLSDAACADRWRRMVAVMREQPKAQRDLTMYEKPMSEFEKADIGMGYKFSPSSAEGKLERPPPPPKQPRAKKPRVNARGGFVSTTRQQRN